MNESPAADAAPPRGFAASTFRALATSQLSALLRRAGLSLFGTWMTLVATRWLVYEKMPGQDWILGFVTFAGQIPILLAPLAGAWVEGASRHRVLVLTQSLSMIQSFALAFLALTGLVEVWQIIALGGVSRIRQRDGCSRPAGVSDRNGRRPQRSGQRHRAEFVDVQRRSAVGARRRPG